MDEDLHLSEHESSNATGSVVAGAMRALLVSMNKGAVTAFVRRQTFMKISSTTMTTQTSNTIPTSTQWKHHALKMLKNSILGVAVFGTYEMVAFEWFGTTDKRIRELAPLTSLSIETPLRSVVASSTPVIVHAGAGACAGVAHSGVTIVWDILQRQLLSSGTHLQHSVLHHWPQKTRLLMQHSIGYASLFGTYEATRRLLEYGFYNILSHQEEYVQESLSQLPEQCRAWMKHPDGTYNIIPVRILYSFLAGGLAGQVHHVVREVVANPQKLHLPKIRSTLPSFWMTGLCFAAFEFGGDFAEWLLDHKTIDTTLQKP